MNIDGGVNPSSNDSVSAELAVESETVGYRREPPPPYTSSGSVVTSQPVIHQTIIVQPPLKNGPQYFNCPNCHDRVLTKVNYVNTQKTHLIAGFICGFTCWCCLCCLAAIPYLISTCKNTEHFCPRCNKFLGDYSKL